MADLRKRFGRLVAAQRRRRGWTQLQLAEAANLSPTMIVRIEGGSSGARFPSIERIAAALNVDPSELFSTASSHEAVRPTLIEINSQLIGLSDPDLEWIGKLVGIALQGGR